MVLTQVPLAVAGIVPENVALAIAGAIERSTQHKEEIRQTVQVLAGVHRDGFVMTEMNDGTLGATADGA